LIDELAQTECPAITARRSRRREAGGVSQDPVVWRSASGANVEDVDGNVYVDLTSAFAVAGLGHAHPAVVEAARKQSEQLIHAMGDLYPSDVKIALASRLAEITPGPLQQSILAMTGAEAVEAALKSAAVATGKSTVVAFSGSYHGLSYGALAVTGYRASFRVPFRAQLGRFGAHLPYAYCYRCPLQLDYPGCGLACLELTRDALDNPASGVEDVGAVIVEPILGRGGVVVPPDDWMQGLAAICRERSILLIADEIFTGMGRTGEWFACQHLGLDPDLMCLGKGLGGGFPISAAIGSPEVMEKWGLSQGEAIHTSTFLGNPLGCAMALAAIDAIERDDLVDASRQLGTKLESRLMLLAEKHALIGDVRGRGSMWGVELVEDEKTRAPAGKIALHAVRCLLERGYLVLPSGARGNVISLVPPFVVTDAQLEAFFEAFDEVLQSCAS
jgi:4-aminobutyrate aminotransferase